MLGMCKICSLLLYKEFKAIISRAIKSPQLLELSGIGNAVLLSSVGIEPIVDLPAVGENVQEHFTIGLSWGIYVNTSCSTMTADQSM